jgi:hypothetical protein
VNGRPGQLNSLRHRRIGLLIGAVVAAACMCLVAVYNGAIAIGLATHGTTTDATVVRVDRFPRGSRVTVEFITRGGDKVSAECTSCSSKLDEDDRVTIRYNPDFPVDGVEDAENHGARRVALFALVAVVLLLSAVGFLGWRLFHHGPRL